MVMCTQGCDGAAIPMDSPARFADSWRVIFSKGNWALGGSSSWSLGTIVAVRLIVVIGVISESKVMCLFLIFDIDLGVISMMVDSDGTKGLFEVPEDSIIAPGVISGMKKIVVVCVEVVILVEMVVNLIGFVHDIFGFISVTFSGKIVPRLGFERIFLCFGFGKVCNWNIDVVFIGSEWHKRKRTKRNFGFFLLIFLHLVIFVSKFILSSLQL